MVSQSYWHSMTGFGQGQVAFNGWTIDVQIRSVNHRGCEVRATSTPKIMAWEHLAQKRIRDAAGRGKVDVAIRYEKARNGDLFINGGQLNRHRALVWQYKIVLGKQHTKYIPTIEEGRQSELLDETSVTEAVDKAIGLWLESRAAEGEALRQLVQKQLAALSSGLDRLENYLPLEQKQRADNLSAKISEYGQQLETKIDASRIQEEIAVLLVKGDVTEEVERIKIHCQTIDELFSQPGPVGKKLDVLAQEMIRETHTLSAKASQSQMKQAAIELRHIADQMREQVQNVE